MYEHHPKLLIMKVFIKITYSLLFIHSVAMAQQEPQYTQNQFNSSLMINPAYAGKYDCGSIAARYRTQWAGINGHPSTAFITGETKVLSPRLGVGINYYYDKLGIETNNHLDLNVAYHLPINSKGLKLSVGLKGGFNAYRADFSKLVNINPGDPLYGAPQKRFIPSIGLGGLLYNDQFYIGLSSPQLINFESPTVGDKLVVPHFYLYGGVRFEVDDRIELRPALLFKYQQQAPLEADIALNMWYAQTLGLGVAYRTQDALNFMLQYKFSRITVGYSYDMNVSGLKYFNNGSHEVFVGVDFCPRKNSMDDRVNTLR